jgi:predicted ATPase/DNA-binding SARP family transcriptional activator
MDLLCRIELFGQLKVIRADQEVTRFRTHKIGWLLAYLALHLGQSIPRERLLDLFWPDAELSAGRDSLNNALSVLRRQLEPAGFARGSILIADYQLVRLNSQAVGADVQEFEQLLLRASRVGALSERIALLERAAALYRGDLLPGCYEEWASLEQRRLQQRYVEALDRWSEALEQTGDLSAALAVIERALKADAYREESYLRQIRLYFQLGQPAAARQSVEQMERRFEAELGMPPSEAARQLVQQLQRKPGARVSAPTHSPERPTVTPSVMPNTPPAPPQVHPKNDAIPPVASSFAQSLLPLPLTRFFGREEELAQLNRILTAEHARLITLTGPGGAGKTRLALEVARQLGPSFAGRVWWVALADLPDASLMPYALAHTLKLTASASAEPLEQVQERLGSGPCLLVLDNFEHLLRDSAELPKVGPGWTCGSVALVRLLLERLPGLVCLITSRQPLQLSGEREFALPPLPWPETVGPPEQLLRNESVALYVDRAQASRPDFALTAHNADAVVSLCRKLEGMPLAIEMAAAWARTVPPARMLERLAERMDALTSRHRDLPPRHRSLRAAIDWSYDLLLPNQQRLLARLSAFRGGWTLEAAETVCGAVEAEDEALETLDGLTELVEKSLVICDAAGDEERYRLLEVVRQYAQERLQEQNEEMPLKARHYRYFVEFIETALPQLRGAEQADWLDRVEQEHDNLRAALDWSATEAGRYLCGSEAELRLASGLRLFWDRRGYWQEGRQRLLHALTSTEVGPLNPRRAGALLGAGVLAANLGDYAKARSCYEEALAVARQIDDRDLIGGVTMALGNLERELGAYAVAQRWFEESLAIWSELQDSNHYAAVLGNMALLLQNQGDLGQARRLQEECLTIARDHGVLNALTVALNSLAGIEFRQTHYAQALALLAENLTLQQRLRDPRLLIFTLNQVAFVRACQGAPAVAVRLWAAIETLRAQTGERLRQSEADIRDSNFAEARRELGDEAFKAACAQGSGMAVEATLEYALQEANDNAAPA